VESLHIERRPMERTYDIFEVFPDGTRRWKTVVPGHEAALTKMKALAANSPNEFLMMHALTKAIIAVLPNKSKESEG